MNREIESLYQAIGNETLACIPSDIAKVLVYAEVQGGVISAQLYYVENGKLVCKLCSMALERLIYDLWSKWSETPGGTAWRAISFVVDGGKFAADLVYPDKFDEKSDDDQRRTLVANKILGRFPVVYL